MIIIFKKVGLSKTCGNDKKNGNNKISENDRHTNKLFIPILLEVIGGWGGYIKNEKAFTS